MKNLILSSILLFSLASCVNPETGKREVFGKSTGELLSFGIGLGRRVAPIAQEEWQKTGSK